VRHTIKGVLFDLFGTLISPPSELEILEILKSSNIGLENLEQTKWMLQAFPMSYVSVRKNWSTEVVRDFLLLNSAESNSQLKLLLQSHFESNIAETEWKIVSNLYQQLLSKCTLYHGVNELLSKLRKNGFKLAIISNISQQWIPVLNKLNIEHYFDEIVLSCEKGVKKPSNVLFEICLSSLNLRPEEMIMIGDSLKNDIKAAQKMKFKTIWFKDIELTLLQQWIIKTVYRNELSTEISNVAHKIKLLTGCDLDDRKCSFVR